ncbi:hypothetical protein [Cupriavidus sp. CP313]
MPNAPDKSIKGVLVEHGPGGFSPGHAHESSAFIYATTWTAAIEHDLEQDAMGFPLADSVAPAGAHRGAAERGFFSSFWAGKQANLRTAHL